MLYSRVLAGLAGALVLAGCGSEIASTVGLGGGPAAVSGALVVGDEPFAVRTGAAILGQGGDAADAASAMYFALSVTYPVAAGLGGGGVCVVYDPVRNTTQEFDFEAREPAAAGAYAVPGNVRGIAMMQAAYGALPWQKVVSPAEVMARTGVPISRALATRLADNADVIRLDASLAAAYLDESGKPKPVDSVVVQPDLADTLSAIRAAGPDGFYTGPVGARLAAYGGSEGGSLTAADLAAAKADVAAPRALSIGSETVYLPSHDLGVGAFSGVLLANLAKAEKTSVGAKDLQASVLWALQQSLKDYHVADLPKDFGATGFAAVDARGQAVACAVTMNAPFGSGHTARATGVTLARAPSAGPAGLASAFLSPAIVTHRNGEPAKLAGAGAGGPNGVAAMAYAIGRLAQGDEILSRNDLRTTGLAPYETINAIVCFDGSCAALPDPGGNGLGAFVPVKQK